MWATTLDQLSVMPLAKMTVHPMVAMELADMESVVQALEARKLVDMALGALELAVPA